MHTLEDPGIYMFVAIAGKDHSTTEGGVMYF